MTSVRGGESRGVPAPGRAHRKRGTTLIEVVLYLTIATVVLTFSAGLLREEQVRRERVSYGAELKQVISATQVYVAANYEGLRDRLLNDTAAGGPLIGIYPISIVVSAGYLPPNYVTGVAPRSFARAQDYNLVVRAVRRNDTGNPSAPPDQRFPETVIRGPGIVDSANPAKFLPELIDRVTANDEIDLEVLLVTTSSDPCNIVPALQANRITSITDTVAAGYITGSPSGGALPDCPTAVRNDPAWQGTLTATGPYGTWKLPLKPYEGLQIAAGVPAVQAGRFASLVALQKRPPLSESALVAEMGDSAFRCRDVPANSAEELACSQSEQMFSDIRFAAWDSDGDSVADTYPAMQNVFGIEFADPVSAGAMGDGDPATLSSVTIGSGEAALAAPPQIGNLLTISCAAGGTVTPEESTFKVDCPTTEMQGLVVANDATFGAGVTVSGTLAAEDATLNTAAIATAEIATASVTDELLIKGVNVESKFVNTVVHTYRTSDSLQQTKPSCPPGYVPAVAAIPASFSASQDLRSVTTSITEAGGGWAIDLIVSMQSGNGNSETIDTNPRNAQIFVQTRCDPE